MDGEEGGCCGALAATLDPLMLILTPAGGIVNKRDSLARKEECEKEILPVLQELKGEGTAFLVCNTPGVAGNIIRRSKQHPLMINGTHVTC